MPESPPDSDLRRVYRTHVRAVYAFLAYSVDRDTAEDLTSATFERAVRAWDSFDPAKASERTWLLTIARNALTDHFRRQSHRAGPSVDEHPEILDRLAGARDPLAIRISIDAAKEWLVQLGPREREALALRYGADMSAGEIAAAMDLSTANIHQIISRALRQLRTKAESDVSGRS